MIDTTKASTQTAPAAVVTPEQLAKIGGGVLAYVRPILSQDAQRLFPQIGSVQPDLQLFALLAADGTPIMLTDSRDAAVANAWENDLKPVSIH